jgi:response regulator NasT
MRKLHVAVAAADAADRESYRRVLASLGHEARIVETGRDLLELCRAAAPDLVVLDDRLPDGDGNELAAAVCRERALPVLVASSAPNPAAIWAAAECHVLGVVPKPLCAEVLGTAVAIAARSFRRIVEAREEAEQLRQALDDRKVIERAKGLLMHFAGLTEDEAYRRIRGLATRGGRKVIDVAREVISAGEVFGQVIDDGHSADGPARPRSPARVHHNGYSAAASS